MLHEVIPTIDKLQEAFDVIQDDIRLPNAVRHGAARASIVLSKYYARTDQSDAYRIAMRMFFLCAGLLR